MGAPRASTGTPVRREAVGHDGGRRRRTAGFADPDADAAQQELEVITRQAAERREAGPDDERCRQNIAPVRTVGQPGNGDAECDIEQRQRNAREKRDARVSQLQFYAYRLEHGGDHVSIGDVDGVDQTHEKQHVPALNRGGSLGARNVDRGGAQTMLPPAVISFRTIQGSERLRDADDAAVDFEK